jgi:hypothetical protein
MLRYWLLAILLASPCIRAESLALEMRLDRPEAWVIRGEDVGAIQKLQRSYGYYVDQGMWQDVLQPVSHLDAGATTAQGRWRTLALFGNFGGGASWAEGVYAFTYIKDAGVWKIQTFDYYSGFGAPYATGWIANPSPSQAASRVWGLTYPADRPPKRSCGGFPAAGVAPFHDQKPGTVWTPGSIPADRGMWDEVANLARSRELAITGTYQGQVAWSEGDPRFRNVAPLYPIPFHYAHPVTGRPTR